MEEDKEKILIKQAMANLFCIFNTKEKRLKKIKKFVRNLRSSGGDFSKLSAESAELLLLAHNDDFIGTKGILPSGNPSLIRNKNEFDSSVGDEEVESNYKVPSLQELCVHKIAYDASRDPEEKLFITLRSILFAE